MIKRFFLIWVSFWCVAAQAAVAQPDASLNPQNDHPLLQVRSLDQRVATVGHRLSLAGADFCAQRQWLPGFAVHDLSQYGQQNRDAAVRLFGLSAGPGVLALAAGGPAEQAGLALDDILLAVDGRILSQGHITGSASFDTVEQILTALEQAFSDGIADLSVRRGGQVRTIRVQADQGCASRFQLIPSGELNARADGRYVQVTTAIGEYVRDDAELAAVLAHEFAHNVLQHKLRLDEAGISRGFFGNFGRSARLTRETEFEADRLSVYLLEKAGYDPEAAIRFWTRFGPRGLGLFTSPTHPHWRRRVAVFQEELANIRRQKETGARLMPSFLSNEAGAER